MSTHKRQKVPETKWGKLGKLQENCQDSTETNSKGRKLETLPPEILEIIFRMLPLEEVSSSVRLVSRHCSTVAATVLNAVFLSIGGKLDNLNDLIEKKMREANTDVNLFGSVKALNALRLIKVQYQFLRAVTWRYTHPPSARRKFPRLCFYAGSLLDDLNILLVQVAKCYVFFCVEEFIVRCKRFMDFFEKVSERRVNRSALVSGCKIVDILDCLLEGRQVLNLRTTRIQSGNAVVNMKLRYVIKHAWFACLSVTKNPKENSWRDRQRFMYLRLRRLVNIVNEHLIEGFHYQNELLLQIRFPFPVKLPAASTYSGYGEYGGQFFYYGNMNKYAYESKFVNTARSTNSTEQQLRKSASFDLVIDIELKCSSDLAPLAIRSTLKTEEFEAYETKSLGYQQLFLKMTVTCPACAMNRLPGTFVWELSAPRYCLNS